MRTRAAARSLVTLVLLLFTVPPALPADVSKAEAEKLGVTWSAKRRKEGNQTVTVIQFANSNADKQYTVRFKLSWGLVMNPVRNLISKEEFKMVLGPASKQEMVVPPPVVGEGFQAYDIPAVVSLAITRSNSKR